MSTLTASQDTVMKLLQKIPDLGEEAVKQTWKMVTHTRKFTGDQKKRLVSALKKNKHVKRRTSTMTKSPRKTIRGGTRRRGTTRRGTKRRGTTHRRKTRCR